MTALRFEKSKAPRVCGCDGCIRAGRYVVHIASHTLTAPTLSNDLRVRVCSGCMASMQRTWDEALEGFPAQDEQARERLGEAA